MSIKLGVRTGRKGRMVKGNIRRSGEVAGLEAHGVVAREAKRA